MFCTPGEQLSLTVAPPATLRGEVGTSVLGHFLIFFSITFTFFRPEHFDVEYFHSKIGASTSSAHHNPFNE